MNNWILPDIRKEECESKIKQKSNDNTVFHFEYTRPNYVLIDAALWGADIDVLFLDKRFIYRSLFRGSTGEKLWSVAPYLVDITSNEKLIERIKSNNPVDRRVTWLYSSENIDDLRKHLRRFLRMKRDDDGYIYFRFYDPFVVNVVFPNLNKEQLREFFGIIKYIIADDYRINERRIYHLSDGDELVINVENIKSLDDVDNK